MEMPPNSAPQAPEPPTRPCAGMRWVLIALGFTCVALGVLGLFLPVLPTTVFLLIACWAFSKSSERFHHWLYHHPRLGGPIRAWHAHRVIPRRAKVLAVGMMAASVAVVALFVADGWLLPVGLALGLSAVAGYILSRPSTVLAAAERS